MTTSGQSQFRNTQTPSKVVHLRNLPWECTEEELILLCTPFGKVMNTMCNVGANRNQAFVEFEDINHAITMVTYYASSSEPAQVRGRNVYIQYSNRPEIVKNKCVGDALSNVLLVSIEGVQAGDVGINIIHLVFSAFGTVQKIATFEKAAGFQALVQYSDAETATAAKEALDGRCIPRYLLPDHVGSCNLRISYSAHKDLNIKYQSNGSRDYTNPYLPVNSTAVDGSVQPTVGPDGTSREPASNVLLASIENMQYAVTVDVLHTLFSAFGTVQKIAIFEKNGGTQALIQFADVSTATIAKDALEGHCIYDGGYCKLHLSYSRHTDLSIKIYSDKSRDYTVSEGSNARHQAMGFISASTAWPASRLYPTGQIAASGTVQDQAPSAQGPSPNMQAGQGTFISVPSTFPGQLYPTSQSPVYATASHTASGVTPLDHGSHMNPNAHRIGIAQPAYQSNMWPGGASPLGRPPFH